MGKWSCDNFINRELSWLEFNNRVLEETLDESNPLFEKIKFCSITSSNLDEFFMVRVASIIEQIHAEFTIPDIAGFTPEGQLTQIRIRVRKMVEDEYVCYRKLLDELREQKIYIVKPEELNEAQKKYITEYYYDTVFPILTPMVMDSSRPFPLILNRSLNIALFIEGKDDSVMFGTVQVPSVIGRIIKIPSHGKEVVCILLEDVIKMFAQDLFKGHKVITMGDYRITRNADLTIDEEGAEDLLETIEQSVKRRKWGEVVRVEVEDGIDLRLLNKLKEEVEADEADIYIIDGPIDLTFLNKLASLEGYDWLRYPKFEPQPILEFYGKDKDMFEVISKQDVLAFHPYQSFEYVVDLVKKASKDPRVLAIKQTLYRVSGNSPIVNALMEAAENGKQVTVLVELKARFDEENNIVWAKKLEKAGCHVIYGLLGLKIHGKVLLIVRNEKDGIKRYVHLATGNYNDVTANFYTDLGLFTSNNLIASDASSLFNMLSGYSQISEMNKLYIAPINLRKKFLLLIKKQIENAKEGKRSLIVAKVNSLVDKEIIEKLYDASEAGVKISLIVRGICCLRPGIKGVSENIKVISIVGRFLEHSRVFYFRSEDDEAIYLSSADWMNRNLDRRVEILFPVESSKLVNTIKEQLNVYLNDNAKARILNMDGTYTRTHVTGQIAINSQAYFEDQYKKYAKKIKKTGKRKQFKPIKM
ncbi:RNA degradosome polyphosphate kinase [Clostridium guangxiense]|uniref:RNA degradosome polyphosphate kinase n=1 Tax=Clostridium guangxiense TaxID=1662055 RepID=UPI001E38D7E6|nr:RNA degradosome polyphosphate kinase [Clostridium guangxiense]MCD2348600.1 RNA degradosome polyphosphate kinase [Clostridium guangxiense]